MLRKLSIALCILPIIFYSCQKEVDRQTTSSATTSNANTLRQEMVDSTGRWYGTALGFLGDPDAFPDTVSEAALIHNGEAFVEEVGPDKHSLSSVGYYLPAGKNISGDSCIFTASVKDDAGVIQLDIMGTQNMAHFTCVNKADSSALTLSVGNAIATAVVKPAINFSVFRNTSFEIRGNTASVFVGVHHEIKLAFTGADKIGIIKLVSVGYNIQPHINSPENYNIECSGMRLHNSYSRQVLMKETFSSNGKSNTVFY